MYPEELPLSPRQPSLWPRQETLQPAVSVRLSDVLQQRIVVLTFELSRIADPLSDSLHTVAPHTLVDAGLPFRWGSVPFGPAASY